MADPHARQLRRSMTDAERRLWSILRSRRLSGYKFRRQHPIGRFVADFACIRHRLVIEADGGQHDANVADERRTAQLGRKGWRVVRFWNNEILANPAGVAQAIVAALDEVPHPPGPMGRAPPSPAARARG
ncbi:MAG: endonuclease domain-containing protein [Alphaproteobacteria bacterium]|nr:endonuclease domain-containing protein [Alphaproteobacteria bacterium]